MPKIYRQNCEWCGIYYEGEGKRFCSSDCANESRRAPNPDSPPTEVNEDVCLHVNDETANVFVYASEKITTPEELLAATDLDMSQWEQTNAKVNTWQVPMKVDGTPTIVQCYYVSVSLRKRIKPHEFVRSLIVNVTSKKYSAAKGAHSASVHWSDIHFPYEDPRTLDILFQILDITEPHLVCDHGDTMDCEELGTYAKDPWNRTTLGDEIKMAGSFLGEVHAMTPGARHIWLEGNHEDRLRRVIWKAAERRDIGEILTLPGMKEKFEWGNLLGVDTLGWEVVNYGDHELLYDKLILKHGSVVRKDSGTSARAEYSKYGKSGLSGHTHRRGAFHHRDYNGTHTWYEMGMMGMIREDYVDHADWQQGLMVISWSEDRTEWGPEPVPIHDGVAYFRGLRLEGKG